MREFFTGTADIRKNYPELFPALRGPVHTVLPGSPGIFDPNLLGPAGTQPLPSTFVPTTPPITRPTVFPGIETTGFSPGTYGGAGGRTAFSSQDEKAAFIVQEALKRGIDPAIALAVAKSEGFNGYTGDSGSSFGAFQLHYGNIASGGNAVSGLGDVFTAQTGLDARDPTTEREQIKFALDQAAQSGWSPWHGWKGDPRAGLTGAHGPGEAPPTPEEIPAGLRQGRTAPAPPRSPSASFEI